MVLFCSTIFVCSTDGSCSQLLGLFGSTFDSMVIVVLERNLV